MDEIEIINLHKMCNKKARKVSQPKKALSKSNEPKKVSGPSEEGQKPKKVSVSDEPKKVSGSPGFIDDPSDGKKTTTKAGKKV